MPTLTHDTQATQIEPTSHKEIASCILAKGTAYTIENRYTDMRGLHWQLIVADGYLYEIEDKPTH